MTVSVRPMAICARWLRPSGTASFRSEPTSFASDRNVIKRACHSPRADLDPRARAPRPDNGMSKHQKALRSRAREGGKPQDGASNALSPHEPRAQAFVTAFGGGRSHRHLLAGSAHDRLLERRPSTRTV